MSVSDRVSTSVQRLRRVIHSAQRDAREHKSSVVIVTANNAASFALLAAIALATSRFLGPAGRGVVVIFTTTASFALLFSTLGSNIAARVRLVSETDRLLIGHYLGLALLLALLDVVVCATAGLAVLALTGALVTPWVLPLLVLHSGVYLFGYLVRFALAAFGYNNIATRSDVLYAGAQLVMLFAVHLAFGLQVNSFLGIVVLTTGVQTTYVWIRFANAGLAERPRFPRYELMLHIRRSLPALMMAFFQASAFRLDRLIVGVLMGPAAVGIYTTGATLSDLATLVPLSVSQVLFSTIALRRATPTLMHRWEQLNIAVTCGVVALIFISGPVLIHALLGPSFDGAAPPLRILLVSAIPLASYYFNITVVAASGALSMASRATAIGCLSDVILCFVLVPPFGVSGAAAASVIAYGLMAYAAWRYRRGLAVSAP